MAAHTEIETARSISNVFRATGFEVVGVTTDIDCKQNRQRLQLGAEPENHITYQKDGKKSFISMHYQPERTDEMNAQRTTDLLIELDESNNVTDVVLQVTQRGKVILYKGIDSLEYDPQSQQANYDFLAHTGANRLSGGNTSIIELLWIASNCALYQHALDHDTSPQRLIAQANAIRQIDELDLRNRISVPKMLARFDVGDNIYHFDIPKTKVYGSVSISQFTDRQRQVQVEPRATVVLELPQPRHMVPTLLRFCMGGQFAQLPRQEWSGVITYGAKDKWVKPDSEVGASIIFSRVADAEHYRIEVHGEFADADAHAQCVRSAQRTFLLEPNDQRDFYSECRFVAEALLLQGE